MDQIEEKQIDKKEIIEDRPHHLAFIKQFFNEDFRFYENKIFAYYESDVKNAYVYKPMPACYTQIKLVMLVYFIMYENDSIKKLLEELEKVDFGDGKIFPANELDINFISQMSMDNIKTILQKGQDCYLSANDLKLLSQHLITKWLNKQCKNCLQCKECEANKKDKERVQIIDVLDVLKKSLGAEEIRNQLLKEVSKDNKWNYTNFNSEDHLFNLFNLDGLKKLMPLCFEDDVLQYMGIKLQKKIFLDEQDRINKEEIMCLFPKNSMNEEYFLFVFNNVTFRQIYHVFLLRTDRLLPFAASLYELWEKHCHDDPLSWGEQTELFEDNMEFLESQKWRNNTDHLNNIVTTKKNNRITLYDMLLRSMLLKNTKVPVSNKFNPPLLSRNLIGNILLFLYPERYTHPDEYQAFIKQSFAKI